MFTRIPGGNWAQQGSKLVGGNSVGAAQVDGTGDDKPAGELNRADKPGMNFGFPYFGGGKTRTEEYKDQQPPADATFPQVELDAHAGDLGMTFYNGRMFPQKYQGGIFFSPTRLMEPHNADRHARHVHQSQSRWHGRQDRSVR